MSAETTRIVTALHKGVSGLPYDMIVGNKAGDVLAIVNAVWEANREADVWKTKFETAEAQLKALQPVAAE